MKFEPHFIFKIEKKLFNLENLGVKQLRTNE